MSGTLVQVAVRAKNHQEMIHKPEITWPNLGCGSWQSRDLRGGAGAPHLQFPLQSDCVRTVLVVTFRSGSGVVQGRPWHRAGGTPA